MSAWGRRASCGVLFVALNLSCVIPITSTPIQTDAGAEGAEGAPDVAIPTGTWINVTGTLANLPSTCGNLTLVSSKPDEDLLIAGVANNGLWASAAGGSWKLLGAASDASAPITNRPYAIVYDPTNHSRFWMSGSYGPCVYETTDDGDTFVQLGSAAHCDGLGVDFSDPNRQTLVAGAHETPQGVNRSSNGGMTWDNIGAGLPTGVFCNNPFVINAQTYLVGCEGAGIYRTADGGSTWTKVTASGAAGPPLVASDNSIYWGNSNGGLTRSTNGGQTWTNIASSTVVTGGLASLPEGGLGDIAGQYVVASSDQGVTWTPVTSALPATPAESVYGIAYSSQQKAFYVWHNDCGALVPSDAVMRYNFAYHAN